MFDENDDLLSEPLAGGIRLKYVPADPLGPGDLGSANLGAAVQYMRTAARGNGKSMTLRLYSSQPNTPPAGTAVVSGSGYTRGGQAPVPAQVTPVNQPLPPGSHPVTCQCVLCMPVQPAGAIPGCNCPVCAPARTPGANCTCPSCQAFRQMSRTRPWPAFAPGGIVPSPPAASASQPPSYVPARTRPRVPGLTRGMDGFDGAPLVAGTALGYRWWTFRAPQLHLNPWDAGSEWEPGLLRGVKDFWQPGVNQARCQAGLQHPHGPDLIPHEDCGCGFWAYWEIQQHDMGAANSLPVVGVVKASGNVIMGPRGFRAAKAEIVALYLPFRIEPDLPAALRAEPARPRLAPRMPPQRFTGRVISFPGAPPVPPSMGGPPLHEPPPLPPLRDPPPPTEEEIQAAKDKAVAWKAVIEDRLATTYPGAEVCAGLDLMKAKYPVKSEYEPPEPADMTIACPYCGTPCTASEIHMHVVSNHYF